MADSRRQTTLLLGNLLMHDLFHHPSDPRYYWAREVTFDYSHRPEDFTEVED